MRFGIPPGLAGIDSLIALKPDELTSKHRSQGLGKLGFAHTNLSFDAGLVGTSLDVHDGFRVARGEKVISNSGQPVQLIRPLDFLVITDHAEMMGLAPDILVCNAGVNTFGDLELIDGVEKHFVVNFLGHFVLVDRLVPGMVANVITESKMRMLTAKDYAEAAETERESMELERRNAVDALSTLPSSTLLASIRGSSPG